MIVMKKAIKVDGKVRTELNFPAGFMDVISIEATGENFRLLYDTKGRFILHKVSEAEASFKLARVVNVAMTSKTIPFISTHDGRTIRYPDPLIKAHDTVKIDLATGKVLEFLKFEVGNTVMITKGANTGRVGTLIGREKHEGSFDIVQVKDATGAVFATRLANAFTIGKGDDAKVRARAADSASFAAAAPVCVPSAMATTAPPPPNLNPSQAALISLPKGKGIALNIFEEREKRGGKAAPAKA